MTTTDVLIVADAVSWQRWLASNGRFSNGIWLLLAKNRTTEPTSLSYAQALDEALCWGWIDGQRKGVDDQTFSQRFTPRRTASLWSQRNIRLTETLIEAGRMRPEGIQEIDRAKADGRWDRAYAGQATAEVPIDLAAAIAVSEAATVALANLSKAQRYSIIHPVVTAPTAASRANRIAKIVATLAASDIS